MVRRLRVEEIGGYQRLRREMLVDSPWAFTASPDDDKARDASFLASSLGEEGNAILVAVHGETIVAAAGVARDVRAKRKHVALLWGVYVDPAWRGKGVGRAVVGAAIEFARGLKGLAKLQLAVSENAPEARAMYESLGFTAWGVEQDGVREGGRSWGETYMELRLE